MSTNVVFLTGRNEYDLENSLATNPWPILQNAQRQQRVIQAEIRGIENKCFVVWIGTVKGYIPFTETGLASEEEMISMLVSKVPLIVTDLNRKEEHPTFSITKAKDRLAAETRKSLKVNDVRVGLVQRMTQSKAIVDIGGIDAVLPKDDIGWQFVRTPREALKLGQEIKVRVTNIDQDGKVFVSKKALEQDPWVTVTQQLKTKQPYVAEITGSKQGALFLRLADGVAAMATYGKVLPNGSRVVVEIQKIRTESRRINCRVTRVID